jgi:anti-sigma factor RsiW
MNHHLPADWLNDLAEESLDATARERADRHLAECEACRVELEAIRRLRAALHALPRSIDPPHDLRPAVWNAIDTASPTADAGADSRSLARRWRDRPISSMRWQLAAAALLLLAVAATVTFELTRRHAATPAVASAVHAPALASVLAVAERYDRAASELQRIVAEQRARLAPATLRVLDENMRILDAALSETEAALQADPDNAALSDILISAYEKKLGVLRSVTTTAGL